MFHGSGLFFLSQLTSGLNSAKRITYSAAPVPPAPINTKRGIKLGCFLACPRIWRSMFAAQAYLHAERRLGHTLSRFCNLAERTSKRGPDRKEVWGGEISQGPPRSTKLCWADNLGHSRLHGVGGSVYSFGRVHVLPQGTPGQQVGAGLSLPDTLLRKPLGVTV